MLLVAWLLAPEEEGAQGGQGDHMVKLAPFLSLGNVRLVATAALGSVARVMSRSAIFGAIIPPGGGHEDRGRGGHGGASPGAPLSARGWPLCLGNKKARAAGGASPDLGQRERLRRLVLDHESARVMRARVVTMPGVYVCILATDVCKSKKKHRHLRVAANCVRWLGWGIDCAILGRRIQLRHGLLERAVAAGARGDTSPRALGERHAVLNVISPDLCRRSEFLLPRIERLLWHVDFQVGANRLLILHVSVVQVETLTHQ
jgi:hypothetical protein